MSSKPRRGRPPGSKNKIKSIIPFDKRPEIKKENSDNNVVDVTRVVQSKDELYHCKLCPFKNFKLKENYEAHLQLEHSTFPDSIPCKECIVVCPDEETLKLHVAKSHVKEFSCEHCGKHFARHSHVLRHMTQKGCGKSIASYPCEICKACFSRKDNLLVHLRTMHIEGKPYRCKYCSFTSKNLTKLIRHWHSKHSDNPHTYICDLCGKSTTSRAAMAKHFEIHGVKKYKCDVCSYTTHTVEVMRRHVLTHVEDKPYKCEQCDASFIQRSQLQKHLLHHVGVPCPICNATLSTKTGLVKHLKEHSVVSHCPFPKCSKVKFPNTSKFETHLTAHLQRKQYPCEVCKKMFQNEMNMRRHLSTHTLDKPRRCMYCVTARAYVRGQQLVRHVRRCHAAVFRAHLTHVRQVIGGELPKKETAEDGEDGRNDRVTSSEMECVLNVLDAEADRILEGYSGAGVLYGGMQDVQDTPAESGADEPADAPNKDVEDDGPLMSEEKLVEQLTQLLEHLIDAESLECLGWPEEPVDVVLEKVVRQCGGRAAQRDVWARVQCLRENAKQLFLYAVEDKAVARMLDTHTIDQIINHMLAHLAKPDD